MFTWPMSTGKDARHDQPSQKSKPNEILPHAHRGGRGKRDRRERAWGRARGDGRPGHPQAETARVPTSGKRIRTDAPGRGTAAGRRACPSHGPVFVKCPERASPRRRGAGRSVLGSGGVGGGRRASGDGRELPFGAMNLFRGSGEVRTRL